MSANYDQIQKSISTSLLEQLKLTLDKSWLKSQKSSYNSSSVAITSNNNYFSGLLESTTHLLDITSEHATLALAISHKDPYVKQIITLMQTEEFVLNPLVIKILVDHVRRTGTSISYSVFDLNGNNLFHCDDVRTLYYTPQVELLEKVQSWEFQPNFIYFDKSRDIDSQLKECALKGTETHFSSGTKSLYGASVFSGDKIYFAGVHSSYDRRLNLHAEMVAFISALSDGNKEISAVGLISTKFIDEVPHVCGCCRQFLSEIQLKNNKEINIYSFSFDGNKTFKISLKDYLPYMWDSGSLK